MIFAAGLFSWFSEQIGMVILSLVILWSLLPKDTQKDTAKAGLGMLLKWFFGK